MPWSKEEIKTHVNELISRLKEGSSQSGFQGFAEIYIAGEKEKEETRPQAIIPQSPTEEPIRSRFTEMRRLSKNLGSSWDTKLQAALFYRQAKFMEDYSDDFEEQTPFSMYFPCYQMMSYEQLRSYFSFRTKIRRGLAQRTETSYLFLYIYELINGVGVKDSAEGLEKLLFLWENYRAYEKKLDGYMAQWVKEYFIVKQPDMSFAALVQKTPLLWDHYPKEEDRGFFDLYAPVSDYKYEKSIFYPGREQLFRSCFDYVVGELMDKMDFDSLVFYGRRGSPWQPFKRALYCPDADRKPGNRTVKITSSEIYWYEKGHWSCSKNRVCSETGRKIVGYIIKRIEQFYREALKFKHKIKVDGSKIPSTARPGTDWPEFFADIDKAIAGHYRESTRVSVSVDQRLLMEIREKARITQEKLTVEEAEPPRPVAAAAPVKPVVREKPEPVKINTASPWQLLWESLTTPQRQALKLMLEGAPIGRMHQLARDSGTMLEVLVDGLNEKAIEAVGDSLCDLADTVEIYEEYTEDLERVISSEAE